MDHSLVYKSVHGKILEDVICGAFLTNDAIDWLGCRTVCLRSPGFDTVKSEILLWKLWDPVLILVWSELTSAVSHHEDLVCILLCQSK